MQKYANEDVREMLEQETVSSPPWDNEDLNLLREEYLDWRTGMQPSDLIGTGPYVLTEFQYEGAIFERNEYYWNPDPIQFDGYVMENIPEPEVHGLKLFRGDWNVGFPMMIHPTAEVIEEVERQPGNFLFHLGPRTKMEYVVIDCGPIDAQEDPNSISFPWNMIEFRQALAYALDYDYSIDSSEPGRPKG
jgi:ABC-type transport system substrate-binding protein